MRISMPLIGLTAAFTMIVHQYAHAQTDGNRAKGRAFALQTCTPCHRVAPDQLSPPRFANAPAFDAIAKTRGITETSLHAFLSSPHPSMPNLILSQKEQDDVIAYILSLRGQH